ncbi:hypothetical protein RJ55_00541 [Drechmeria coniospora]|nr:hypothetical protein RJ55_00541 [Drechmeria coniospora]
MRPGQFSTRINVDATWWLGWFTRGAALKHWRCVDSESLVGRLSSNNKQAISRCLPHRARLVQVLLDEDEKAGPWKADPWAAPGDFMALGRRATRASLVRKQRSGSELAMIQPR